MPKSVTTIGREKVADALPLQLKSAARSPMDSKTIKALFQTLAEDHPDQYVDVLHELSKISRDVITDYGQFTSLKLKDLDIRELPRLHRLQTNLRKQVHLINQSDKFSPQQKRDRVVSLVRGAAPTITKTLMEEGAQKGNAFVLAAQHGFRGNPTQLTQILFGDLIMPDSCGVPVPVPGLTGYGEGTSPEEYWGGAYGARSGFVAVQYSTADSGYLGKQLTLSSHRQRVTGKDCGAEGVGLRKTSAAEEILGAVLAEPVGRIPAGTPITEDLLPGLRGKDVLIRSPLTCEQEDGVCQQCLGMDTSGRFTPVGEFAGPGEARAASEPFTQMGLGAKHTGGLLTDDDPEQGFEATNRFFQVPEHYPGAASLAQADGTVRQVRKAPQGGYYVFVGDDQIHVPVGQAVTVKKGQSVEAGDAVSEGILNPAEIVRLKGLGEGRRYFANQLHRMMRKNGIDIHRRQVEVVTKGLLDRVVLESEDVLPDTDIGGSMTYSALQKRYVPRKGSKKVTITSSSPKNLHLEEPALHYTIGTRLTPKVRAELRKAGKTTVLAHPDPPEFRPEMVRLAAAITKDNDWRARLAGFHLKKGLLDSAAHGSDSPNDGASFIPALIRPDTIGSSV